VNTTKRDGFSAIEVVLGLTLLALGVLPVFRLLFDTGREAGFSEQHLLASARVQALLDAQEALGWTALATGEGDLSSPAAAGDPLGGRFHERLALHRIEDDLVSLKCEVSWDGHAVRSVRYVSRPDGSWLAPLPLTLTSN
jgi:hypothetical protein